MRVPVVSFYRSIRLLDKPEFVASCFPQRICFLPLSKRRLDAPVSTRPGRTVRKTPGQGVSGRSVSIIGDAHMATVSEILREKQGEPLFTIEPEASVLDAVHRMNELSVGALIVKDAEQMVGIFTERDVLRRV